MHPGKTSLLLLMLAIPIISSGSWAFSPEELPKNGQILLIGEDAYLELGPAESAFLNGTILVK